MLLADLVATSMRVAGTRSRTAKIEALAGALSGLGPNEVAAGVAFLSGQTRQGRVGVGYRTVYRQAAVPASAPTLTVADLDALVDELAVVSGAGSQRRRDDMLQDFFARCTEAEDVFVRRLLTGEIRQGALEGVMADAIARA